VTDPVALLLDRLDGVRRSGTAWLARCPAHEDRHASLAVAAGEDGRALLTCHAGCSTESVVAAIGLAMADLYPRTNGAAGPARLAPPQARDRETRYRVRVADGSLSAERIEHVRLDRADGSKRMWWERDGHKGLSGVSTSSLTLYRIDDVAASGGERAVLVEGEKAADALAAMGIPAVGTVTGAATIPCRDALLPLAALDVVLWPDADGPGLGHMQRIAAELEPIARAVVWVTPPLDAPAGWDAADASPDVARRLVVEARAADPVATSMPDVVVVPAPTSPMGVARRLVADRFTDPDGITVIRAWRGGYCAWDGRCWPDRDGATIRSETYSYLEHAVYEVETPLGTVLKPWDPTKSKVANAIEALAAVTHLAPTIQPPAWLAGEGLPDPRDLVVTANGILHMPNRQLLPHDPRLFVGHSVPFAYDPVAAEPTRWLAFLADLWDDDRDSITLLQEMFGYALSGDTSLQKIMLLVGPTRAGKGVIARVLTHLLGRHNVGAPTLAGLTTNFGLQDLIGKTLAIVSDARLGPKANVQALAERLLSVSGEDSITIDRKYKDPWTGRLEVRFMLLTNELPRFTDASGALAKRFIVLVLSKTFYGKEDPGLLARLLPELPGIMNWALEGLDRLRARHRFSEPGSAREAIRELEDLSSPMSAFLRDRCVVGRDMHVSVDDLWAAWKAWAEDQSQHHGTKQTFGRDLRAVVPGLHVSRPRDGEHKRAYVGLALPAEGNNVADRGPRGPSRPEDACGPHGPRTSALFSQRPPAGGGPDTEPSANDDGWPGDGTGPSDEASVTDDCARVDAGDAGDAPLRPPSHAGLDVVGAALRIFGDDVTEESAARLRTAFVGPDDLEWGGIT
jgi:putative DNA primase/helicase